MRNAKLLSLVGQNLVEVPDEVYENAREAEVTCVDLSRNRLQELTDGLSRVASAQDLKLSYNLLTELPDWLGESLVRLRYLDLSKNLLTSLPASIGRLQLLVEINISFNRCACVTFFSLMQFQMCNFTRRCVIFFVDSRSCRIVYTR